MFSCIACFPTKNVVGGMIEQHIFSKNAELRNGDHLTAPQKDEILAWDSTNSVCCTKF